MCAIPNALDPVSDALLYQSLLGFLLILIILDFLKQFSLIDQKWITLALSIIVDVVIDLVQIEFDQNLQTNRVLNLRKQQVEKRTFESLLTWWQAAYLSCLFEKIKGNQDLLQPKFENGSLLNDCLEADLLLDSHQIIFHEDAQHDLVSDLLLADALFLFVGDSFHHVLDAGVYQLLCRSTGAIDRSELVNEKLKEL